MARNDPQINLRIPAELKERVEAAAAANKRSMNAEIAERLEASLRHDEEIKLPSDPNAFREAMVFAIGRVVDRPEFSEKLAEALATRERKKD